MMRVTAAQAGLLLALQLLAVQLQAMFTDGSCLIDVFGTKNASLTEYRFTWQILLSQVPHECGCRLVLRPREEAIAAITGLKDYPQPTMILIAARGLQKEEEEAIQSAGRYAKAKLVVIHQSDERNNHSLGWYPLVKAVLRNYHRDKATLQKHLQYMLTGLNRPTRVALTATGTYSTSSVLTTKTSAETQSYRHARRRRLMDTGQKQQVQPVKGRSAREADPFADGNVFWIPLGYGEMFVPAPVMMTPISVRPLVWSWTGSWGAKRERIEMIRVLNTNAMLQLGFLFTFQHFKGPQQLPQVRYSTYLYESRLVPLPPGLHPEQFRIYEVLAAGAIPVILKTHRDTGMAHIDMLQFKAVWLDSWADAPQVFTQAWTNATFIQELNSWQQHNNMQYARFLRVLRQTIADVACAVQP